MAEIELTRPTGYRVDRGREYRVDIDSQKVGSIKIGETKVFALPSGRHELRLKQDWAASEKLQIELGDNERAQFVCAPRIKQNEETMMVGLRAIYWTTLGCRRYIDLRPGDEIAAEDEPKRGLLSLNGPKLFGIALVIGIAYWALTGQSIVALGVVVAAIAFVAAGLVAKRLGRAAAHMDKEVQKHRSGSKLNDRKT
jgi:hypothetical protein